MSVSSGMAMRVGLTLFGVAVRVRVQLVLVRSEPETPIWLKDLLAEAAHDSAKNQPNTQHHD